MSQHWYWLSININLHSRSIGQPVELESIHVALEHIMSDSVTPAEFPVGFLTAMGRSDCAKAREELVAIGDNASLLKTIDSSIFVLCIDGKSEANLKLGDIFLHNNGYNRYTPFE